MLMTWSSIRIWIETKKFYSIIMNEIESDVLPIMAHNVRKTHCPQGHPYSGDNLYRRTDGGRDCRACMRERQRRFYARQPKKERVKSTHCRNGHLYSEGNVYYLKAGSRKCKTCMADKQRKYRTRRRAKS